MTDKQLDAVSKRTVKALKEAKSKNYEIKTLQRVLTQLLLQNGGVLELDPGFYDAAINNKKELWFGDGYVELG